MRLLRQNCAVSAIAPVALGLGRLHLFSFTMYFLDCRWGTLVTQCGPSAFADPASISCACVFRTLHFRDQLSRTHNQRLTAPCRPSRHFAQLSELLSTLNSEGGSWTDGAHRMFAFKSWAGREQVRADRASEFIGLFESSGARPLFPAGPRSYCHHKGLVQGGVALFSVRMIQDILLASTKFVHIHRYLESSIM